ncbi:SAM domain-containing protein SAMSN-1a isoform X1 [Esox lucius]|uniref:SAM domain-containing protein SAMSN-1a isoform X1 n=1 Tax=Esox lucius TaxID=8010 RepID=UPI001476AE1E|nr:SAM domain-containing protein SAMSN-1a isoform X1 [Esox lucius]
MNLFCFSLEGSMDSLYEAVQDSCDAPVYTIPSRSSSRSCSRSCSPAVLLDQNPKWTGSGRSISMEISQIQNNTKKKIRRKHLPKSASENVTLDHSCADTTLWLPTKVPPEEDLDLVHIKNSQNEEMVRTEVQAKSGRGHKSKTNEKPPTPPKPPNPVVSYEGWAQNPNRPNSRQRDLIVHASGEVAEPKGTNKRNQKAGSQKPGKKGGAKNGKEAKRNMDTTRHKELSTSAANSDIHGPHPEPAHVIEGPYLDVVRRSAPGCESVQPSAQENASKTPRAMELSSGPGAPARNQRWSNPAESTPSWGTSYHICHRPLTEYRVYANDYTLPRTKDQERHQGPIHDGRLKRNTLLQGVSRSVTDVDLSDPNRSTSFGRFEAIRHQQSPTRLEENGTAVAEESECDICDQTKQGSLGKKMKAISLTMRKKMGKKNSKPFYAETSEDIDRDRQGETESCPPLEKGSEKTSNSLESLYSGQSSSSSGGVASVSDGSSARDSLRMEEDRSYNGHFCGRARVHTDFVPSPYDTDSLKLKVGDIINIISKPPMGIWTGMLNNKVGNFKFIYVDVLMEKDTEEEEEVVPIRPQRMSKRPRPKTLQELLERLHLEEYASALLLNGYQTVEDLKHLQEKHLIELNVADPEHRGRLLAAADCIYKESDDIMDSEEASSQSLKEEKSDCPRDSGCFITSEGSDNSKEETESQHTQIIH